MKRLIPFVLWTASALALTAGSLHASDGVPQAKYVFYFIGDGMSAVQMYAADGYLNALKGGDVNKASEVAGALHLHVDSFPARGMQTTYAWNHFITDSAAAGTALACGSKTNSGMLGLAPSGTEKFTSIAELAKKSGRSVGILTSVSLDHATPAAFYANVSSRGYYDQIAVQAAQSGFDFFGGGSWLKPESPTYRTLFPKLGSDRIEDVLASEGYTTIRTNEGIRALKNAPKDKVVCSAPILNGASAMPYSIDRPEGQVTLAELTEVAIACLMKDGGDKGFFMMVEGGKIDWACHSNDPRGMLGDIVALDAAIGKAVEFYKQHPSETLIVVTGDHETGGLTIGFSGRGYETSFGRLLGQKMSFEAFSGAVAEYRTAHNFPTPYDTEANNIDEPMKTLIRTGFGVDYDSLPDYRRERLEDAFDRSMSGKPAADFNVPTGYDKGFNESEKIATLDYLYYGDYDALTMEVSHQLSHETGLGWTSYSHTAVPVPVMAIGCDSEWFNGYYDNTDTPKKIARAMGLDVSLPVIDQ